MTTSHPDNLARHLVARSDRGYVTEPTVRALANGIKKALAEASVGSRPVETWIEEFDWGTVTGEYVEVLNLTVAGSSAVREGGRAASASQQI